MKRPSVKELEKPWAECVICKKRFNKPHKTTKTCSNGCRYEFLRKRMGTIKSSCRTCGVLIYRQRSIIQKGIGFYCSKKCLSRKYSKPKVLVKCCMCKKEFLVHLSYSKRVKFCSYRCRNIHLIKTSRKKDTGIEIATEKMLNKIGVQYLKQAAIKCIAVVDFYVPKSNLIIQCDGEYWHSFPHKIKNDTTQDAKFKVNGFRVLRLKEKEINKFPAKCYRRLCEAIKNKKSQTNS